MANAARQIVDFLAFSERLKMEMRHSFSSNRRQESVAEHTWQMALLAILSYRHLSTPVDIEKVLKMSIVHDLVEAEAGDVSHLDQMRDPQIKKQKILREQAAIEKIRTMLPSPVNDEIYALWYEFEDLQTAEAKFAKALDDLEVQVQHNLAPLDTWEEQELALSFSKTGRNCLHEPFLVELSQIIMGYADDKLTKANIDVQALRSKVAA